MTNTTLLLGNGYARTIAAMTAIHILLNVFFLHSWWSMVVFMILSITPVMKPDLFLTIMWLAEIGTAAAVSSELLRGHAATVAFIFWSAAVVIICGIRLVRGKVQGASKQ